MTLRPMALRRIAMATAALLALFAGAVTAAPPAAAAAQAATIREGHGVGVVRAVDLSGGSVTLQHGPIVALGWPGMTMPFKVRPTTALKALKVGQTVDFTVRDADAGPLIVAIKAR